jgi:hypothetical protein
MRERTDGFSSTISRERIQLADALWSSPGVEKPIILLRGFRGHTQLQPRMSVSTSKIAIRSYSGIVHVDGGLFSNSFKVYLYSRSSTLLALSGLIVSCIGFLRTALLFSLSAKADTCMRMWQR